MYAAPRHSSNRFDSVLGLQYILRNGLSIFTQCKDNSFSILTQVFVYQYLFQYFAQEYRYRNSQNCYDYTDYNSFPNQY